MDSTVDSGHNVSATAPARRTAQTDHRRCCVQGRSPRDRERTARGTQRQSFQCTTKITTAARQYRRMGEGQALRRDCVWNTASTARRVPIPNPQSKIPVQGLHPTCVGVIAAKIGNVRSSSAACLVCGCPQLARSPSQPSARQRHGEWTARGTQCPPQDVSVDPLQKQSFQCTTKIITTAARQYRRMGEGQALRRGCVWNTASTARRVPRPTPESKIPVQGLHPTCVGVIATKIGNVRSSWAACLVCGCPQLASAGFASNMCNVLGVYIKTKHSLHPIEDAPVFEKLNGNHDDTVERPLVWKTHAFDWATPYIAVSRRT